MTTARIKAADFLNVSSRSAAARWDDVDRLEKLMFDHAAEENAELREEVAAQRERVSCAVIALKNLQRENEALKARFNIGAVVLQTST